ncbi:MAG: DUF1549 and DUF1553 domain-containing protein, partial [Pirellulales bacterium]
MLVLAVSADLHGKDRGQTAAADAPSVAGHSSDPAVRIDRHIETTWAAAGVRPTQVATDAEWCRRATLDLIGRIPTVDELQAYLDQPASRRRAVLVDRLLGDTYRDDYARHWATVWTNLLIGRTGGTERRSLTSRPGMRRYLLEQFRENGPYDQMVDQLITATGSTRPDSESFNGATNFLVGKLADGGIQATAKTAQIFLGVQVQCTQCHNHPFNEWKQSQFWGLNAFFRQTRPLRSFQGREIAAVRLVDEDFAGEGGDPSEADIYYELRNGLVRVAYPVFVDGTALTDVLGERIGNSGYLEDVHRRVELAKLVAHSPLLERVIVNRMWKHFLGYGLTRPVDDMGPHNPPSHPELLDTLAAEMRTARFDLKRLIRSIVLSRPYGLSSRRGRGKQADAPQRGKRPLFSRFYLRPMSAEQLYASLIVATEVDKTYRTSDGQQQAMEKWLQQFTRAFGTDENDETTTFDGTIPQTLMMMNGELVRRATRAEPGSTLDRIARNMDMDDKARIRQLFLAAVARKPTSEELRIASRLLAARAGNVAEALQDIWWALLNSNEFILNH